MNFGYERGEDWIKMIDGRISIEEKVFRKRMARKKDGFKRDMFEMERDTANGVRA